MPDRTLPDRPNLEQYKKQAKELLCETQRPSHLQIQNCAPILTLEEKLQKSAT